MAKIAYIEKNFNKQTMLTILTAEEIINQYQTQGFILTLRQLYYQFVARALIENTDRAYKRLGNVVSDARRAGLLDWLTIEDRTRFIRTLPSWDTPQDILHSARNSYHIDLWATQRERIEVWIEKDALVGVIEAVCKEHDVPFFSCRGYVSDSEMWRAALRILSYERDDQDTTILHLGDHDPSGLDMTRDIEDRLNLFTRNNTNLQVKRIALTMDQIKEQNPPPNPAKVTDSRYERYVQEYGEESWELDALQPQFISDLIAGAIVELKDPLQWETALELQETDRDRISKVIDKWNDLF